MLKEQTIVKWDKNAETDLCNGLTAEQVEERKIIYGPNRLREGKKKSVLQLFWEQLNDPLIYILPPLHCRTCCRYQQSLQTLYPGPDRLRYWHSASVTWCGASC